MCFEFAVIFSFRNLLSCFRVEMSPPTSGTRFGTKAIHAGQDPEKWSNNEIIPPITLSTTFKQTHPGQYKAHDYSRISNSSRDVLQENLAALVGGKYCKNLRRVAPNSEIHCLNRFRLYIWQWHGFNNVNS